MNQRIHTYSRGSSIWLDFRYKGRRYRVSTNLPVTKDGYKAAKGIVARIESDLIFQSFTDERLREYLGKPVETVTQSKTLTELWDEFVERQRERLSETTFRDTFKTTQNVMRYLFNAKIDMECQSSIVAKASEKYAATTLNRALGDLIAFGNWLKQTKHRNNNPYEGIKNLLPKPAKSKRAKKAYSEGEAVAIIDAFRNNTFMNPCSEYRDSHYGNFIEFLFTVGCRPEDAIALTCGDLFYRGSDLYIRIDKSYSKRILKGTKTGVARVVKCNESLKAFLAPCVFDSSDKLIFPAQKGGYIDLKTFTRNYTSRIVKALVKEGRVKEYLGTYNCRHTAITRMMRNNIDPDTIGNVCGTSPEMIFKHYAQPNEDVDLPEIVT